MKRARGAARGVVIQLATFLLFGVVAGIVPARSQAIAGPSDSGPQVAAQLGRTSGVQRYRILYDLKSANRIATGLTVADLNAIIAGMEDQRTRVISLMARELVANLSAADVVALSGQTSGTSRYRILYSLKAANRIAPGLTVADLNAIVVGMEDQRTRVISLMARELVPNLSAADVVALSGQTSGTSRYRILYSLKAANRIAPGLTVADLNAIVAGMEDQRTRVISLMARDLVPNLTAADVVASGGTGGTASAPGEAPAPAPPPTPGILGGCGSSKWQRLAVPEYVCFSMYGGTLPWVSVCSVSLLTGYKPVYFGEACRAHDDCYGSAGATKSRCDQSFRSLLNETCDATLTGKVWTFGRENCHNTTSEFYHQVSTNGCSAFMEGQINAGVGKPTCQ